MGRGRNWRFALEPRNFIDIIMAYCDFDTKDDDFWIAFRYSQQEHRRIQQLYREGSPLTPPVFTPNSGPPAAATVRKSAAQSLVPSRDRAAAANRQRRRLG